MSLNLALRTSVPVGVNALRYSCALQLTCRGFHSSKRLSGAKIQSSSPLAPLGVQQALESSASYNAVPPRPKIFDEFGLAGRVGMVSGGNRGLGLEMAQGLCEAGAKIYCLDLAEKPSEEWTKAKQFVQELKNGANLEYMTADVTDQKATWEAGEKIASEAGGMNICVANAGILQPGQDCLEYNGSDFQQVISVNVNGVLHTAQSAGRQMRKFNQPGSIILIASMSGSITNKGQSWVSYNTSKSAVIQMARSMACELAKENIRVNSLSPGYIYTQLTATFLDKHPHLFEEWSSQNPMGRLGRPDELRGVVTWLASDASSYCTGSDILVSGGHHSW